MCKKIQLFTYMEKQQIMQGWISCSKSIKKLIHRDWQTFLGNILLYLAYGRILKHVKSTYRKCNPTWFPTWHKLFILQRKSIRVMEGRKILIRKLTDRKTNITSINSDIPHCLTNLIMNCFLYFGHSLSYRISVQITDIWYRSLDFNCSKQFRC